jgi:hypothetical protein
MPKPKSQSQAELDAANNGSGMELDPLIEALLGHLPPPGDVFAAEDRKLWLQILELSLKLIYDEEHPDQPDQPEQPEALRQHGGQA